MGGSLKIANIFGIPVRLHWTFFLLFFGLALLGWAQNGSLSYLLWSSLFLLAVFACVVMHEFGHALTARRYGVNTVDIILSPIGGIARLNKLPENPWQEFAVAIAGPLVNIAIALVLSPILFLLQADNTARFFELMQTGNLPDLNGLLLNYFLASLFLLNLMLAIFNLLPAFPMDGGRIFRALLSIPMGRLKATRVASVVGQILAGLMVLYSIYSYSIVLGLIGVFIYLAAGREYRSLQTETILARSPVGAIMRTDFISLHPSDLLQKAVDLYQRGVHRNFTVIDSFSGQVHGLVPEAALIDALHAESIPHGTVENFMVPIGPEPITPDTDLRQAYDLMSENNRDILLVKDPESDKPTGILEMHQIRFFLGLQQRLRAK